MQKDVRLTRSFALGWSDYDIVLLSTEARSLRDCEACDAIDPTNRHLDGKLCLALVESRRAIGGAPKSDTERLSFMHTLVGACHCYETL